jgi:small neutral amino acid transporter SnatA (MarC family)
MKSFGVKMKKLMIALGIFLALIGCASTGTQVSIETASKFKEGVATEREIVSELGRPTSMTMVGSQRSIVYSGGQCQTKAATFIPVVGAFAGGMDCQSSAVVFVLDGNGVAQKIIYTGNNFGSRNGPTVADQKSVAPSAK